VRAEDEERCAKKRWMCEQGSFVGGRAVKEDANLPDEPKHVAALDTFSPKNEVVQRCRLSRRQYKALGRNRLRGNEVLCGVEHPMHGPSDLLSDGRRGAVGAQRVVAKACCVNFRQGS
jgi:hypothetical protein